MIEPVTTSQFVISLDFELMWGVRDHHTKDSYGANVLGVRQAIPRILDEFEKRKIHATWAAVGLLFCEDKDEMMVVSPAVRPGYKDARLSNYEYFGEVGKNELSDPYYFGLDLLKRVQACPGQEIGTHTFSHFYCLEPGATAEAFRADLQAAIMIAKKRGFAMESIVFPRNQYDATYISICKELGLRQYRGNEAGWIYRPTRGSGQNAVRRSLRLADAYVNISGQNLAVTARGDSGMRNIPSSRFLRPFARKLEKLESLRLHRIRTAMTAAAQTGSHFHLWWHPHNFGRNLEENMGVLKQILDHYQLLNEHAGMTSVAMREVHAAASH